MMNGQLWILRQNHVDSCVQFISTQSFYILRTNSYLCTVQMQHDLQSSPQAVVYLHYAQCKSWYS